MHAPHEDRCQNSTHNQGQGQNLSMHAQQHPLNVPGNPLKVKTRKPTLNPSLNPCKTAPAGSPARHMNVTQPACKVVLRHACTPILPLAQYVAAPAVQHTHKPCAGWLPVLGHKCNTHAHTCVTHTCTKTGRTPSRGRRCRACFSICPALHPLPESLPHCFRLFPLVLLNQTHTSCCHSGPTSAQ